MRTNEGNSKGTWALMDVLRAKVAKPFVASLCLAYVCIKCREKGLVDVPNLASFLDEYGVTGHVRELILGNLEREWNDYRSLVASHDLESLRQFMASSDADSRRYSYSAPHDVQCLAFKLIGLSHEDTFADFRCDIGSSLIMALQEFGVKAADGFEISHEAAPMAEMRLDAVGYASKSDVVMQNLFAVAPNAKKYDKAYCCPPFGMRILDKDIRAYVSGKAALPELRPSCSTTWIYALRALDSVNADGQCAMIVNDGSLLNQVELACRKYLVDRNLVEAVISLPFPIFSGTGVSASIVLLNPSKKGSSVLMVDATQLGRKGKGTVALPPEDVNAIVNTVRNGIAEGNIEARGVEPKEIERDKYILHPRRYINTDLVELEFPKTKPLKNLVSIRQGSSLPSHVLAGLTVPERTMFRYATQANIKDGMIEAEGTYLKEMPDDKGECCAKNMDVILTKAGRPIKSAVVNLGIDERLLVSSNQYIITPNTKVIDPYYLKTFFDSAMGQSVLSQISVGVGMPAIALRDLKEIKIPVLPKETQKRIAATYQARQREVEDLRRRLDQALRALNGVFGEIAASDGDAS